MKKNKSCKNRSRKLLLAIPIIIFFASSCSEIFDYHPYDGLLSGKLNVNANNITLIEEQCRDLKEFKFAFISDTQRWYDDTKDAVADINKRSDISFVIHGGDLSDFGVTNEFLWQRDILNKLKIPYVVCLGNHDCIGTGDEVFQKVFGSSNYVFTAGEVQFICLNTVALEYDYSHPIPDFSFIESNKIPSDTMIVKKTIYAMHCRPTDEQFNNNVASYFNYCMTTTHHLQFCLCGHGHQSDISDLFDNGILYFETPNIAKRKYYIFTIKEEGYD